MDINIDIERKRIQKMIQTKITSMSCQARNWQEIPLGTPNEIDKIGTHFSPWVTPSILNKWIKDIIYEKNLTQQETREMNKIVEEATKI